MKPGRRDDGKNNRFHKGSSFPRRGPSGPGQKKEFRPRGGKGASFPRRPDAGPVQKRDFYRKESPAAAEDTSEDLIYGRHPVLEALASEPCRANKLWLLKGIVGGPADEIVRLAQARRVVFQWVERDRLTAMVRSENHQGVVARVAPVAYGNLEDLWRQGTPSPLIFLDGIEDPHNLGAILRSAAFFGAQAVVIPRWRAAGLSGSVMKASAGALAKIPLVQVSNIAQTILDAKAQGYWIYGADGSGDPASTAVLNFPMALVIGAEGVGLHRLVRDRCDALIGIPGSGRMESLNASCAAAVFLHELFRRAPAPKAGQG